MIASFPLPARRLKRIAPLQLGKMAAYLYGAMALIAVPFFLVMSAVMAQMPAPQRGIFALVGVGFAFALPFFYAAMGFIVGVIGAAIYNLLAKYIGGIEVEVA